MKGKGSGKGKLQGQKPSGGTGKPNVTPVGGMQNMASSGGKGTGSTAGLQGSKKGKGR